MNEPTLTCRDDARRHAVRAASLNGLDYVEAHRHRDEHDGGWRWKLQVCFLGRAPRTIRKENVRIEGGRRVRDLRVTYLRVHAKGEVEGKEQGGGSRLDDCMELHLDRPGDSSTYTLRVVALDEHGRPTDRPMEGFDPRYDRVEFTFTTGCPSPLDCRSARVCPEPAPKTPELSYLAKDYPSFRQLALGRLAVVMPGWRERHAPDLGLALVELLAYTADHLSYYQDAVATEAYLATARQRVSVRRHARLVDYPLHEGVNARAWVTLGVESDLTLPPAGSEPGSFDVYLVTGYDGAPDPGPLLDHGKLPQGPPRPYEVFEPVADIWRTPIRLFKAHNEIRFYTWGDRQCCLPRGATRATLLDPAPPTPTGAEAGAPKGQEQCPPRQAEPLRPGHALHLEPGDVLILEELKGPVTGEEADADPRRRHPVRLTRVESGLDPLNGQPIVEIEWHPDDALPRPFCISSVGRPPGCELIEKVSVARGNVVLVDHGRRIEDEDLEAVPADARRFECEAEGRAVEHTARPPRYRPRLREAPLVFAEPYEPTGPASAACEQEPRRALPWIALASGELAADGTFTPTAEWTARRDLLPSDGEDLHFVAEVENDGRARLRFGDGELGARPPAGGSFRATYRVGGGPAGNVGSEAITHLVLRRGSLDGEVVVRNPLPASGGTAPETVGDVQRLASHALRTDLERAITAEDYALLAAKHPEVDRAVARLRRSGCSYKVLVAVDPRGRVEADDELLREVADSLHRYRRIGHEVLVGRALYVPLDIRLVVCLDPEFLRGHVLAALLDRLSNRLLADGSRGFFHPDELSFGDGVYLSRLVAAAQAVAGVAGVPIDAGTTRFQRYGEAANGEIEEGLLPLGPFEIARLDNDPDFPENGTLELDLRGGR